MSKNARKVASPTASRQMLVLEFTQSQALVMSAILSLAYFLYSFISDGFYQDDEIGHFQNMRIFWTEPEMILGNWAKPGFKIVYILPALGGFTAIVLANSLTTGLMSFLSWKLAKAYEIKNIALVLFLCGLQPMLFQLSFRTYSELITGVLLALLVYSVVTNRDYTAAFLGTYLFTIRQELILLAPFVFVWLAWKKSWKAIPVMGIAPLLLLFAGWLAHDNFFWILEEMKQKGTNSNFVRQGFFHYWNMFTPVFGSITTALFLPGLFAAFMAVKKNHDRLKWLALLIPTFVYFLIHCVLTSEFANMSSSAGNLRYLVVLSPLIAVFAGRGFDALQKEKSVFSLPWFISFAYGIIVLLFFSFEYNHLFYSDVRDHSRWIAVFVFMAVAGFLFRSSWTPVVQTVVLTSILTGFMLYNEPPKKNSPENLTVKQIVEWVKNENLLQRGVLINHPLFYFYGDVQQKNPPEKFPGLYLKDLEAATPGMIAIWDSHYSDRPEYKMDVPISYFQNNTAWKPIRKFTSSDQRYVAFVFEKQ